MSHRVAFLIDGFNLYHSVKEASKDTGRKGRDTKWLDIRALCESYLPHIDKTATIAEMHYFSALATHIDPSHPDVTNRHKLFIRCLKDTGLKIHLSRFTSGDILCPHCGRTFPRHEEKETDVALASKLIEVMVRDKCDTAMLMTGDTDLVPAIRSARVLNPKKKIGFVFPYKRKNKRLVKLSDLNFNLRPRKYLRYQFPDPYTLSDGTILPKPPKG